MGTGQARWFILSIFLAVVAVAGCSGPGDGANWVHGPYRNLKGETITDDTYAKFVIGKTDQQEVVEQLGPPTCRKNGISTLDLVYVNIMERTNRRGGLWNAERYYLFIEHIVLFSFRDGILQNKFYITNKYRQGDNPMKFPQDGPRMSCDIG